MGPDPSRPVVLHAHAREEPGTRDGSARRAPCSPARAPRARVARRWTITPSSRHAASSRAALPYGSLPTRQVDPDDVVGRAGLELGPLLGVDHVVGRGDDVLEAAGSVQVVVQRPQRFDIGHAGAGGYRLGGGRRQSIRAPWSMRSGRPDSNRGPQAPKACALTRLRYAPCGAGVAGSDRCAADVGLAVVGSPRSRRSKIPLSVSLPYGVRAVVHRQHRDRHACAARARAATTWWSRRPVP